MKFVSFIQKIGAGDAGESASWRREGEGEVVGDDLVGGGGEHNENF